MNANLQQLINSASVAALIVVALVLLDGFVSYQLLDKSGSWSFGFNDGAFRANGQVVASLWSMKSLYLFAILFFAIAYRKFQKGKFDIGDSKG